MEQEELKKILTDIRNSSTDRSRKFSLSVLISSLDEELIAQSHQVLLDAALEIKSEDDRAYILYVIARKIKGELQEKCLDAISEINNEIIRAGTLVHLLPYLDNELKDRVLKSIQRIKDDELRDAALRHLASELMEEGLIELALATVSEIKDQDRYDDTLSRVVLKIQNRGSHRNAIQIAHAIKDDINRAEVLELLAQRLDDDELTIEVLAEAEHIALEALASNYAGSYRLPDLIGRIRNRLDKLTSLGARRPLGNFIESIENTHTKSSKGIKEEVFFTAYHPKEGSVKSWHTLLVYTYIKSVVVEVLKDAKRFEDQIKFPKEASIQSSTQLARGAELNIIPTCDGVTFNPEHISFKWMEDFHRADFRFKADKSMSGDAGKGSIDIYAGPLLIGTLKFAMLFNEKEGTQPVPHGEHAKMYGKDDVFISYSRKDTDIARTFKTVLESSGLDVFIDVDDIRSGQLWETELKQRIEKAKIFQIFWSQNYSESENCKQEWEYALKQNKEEGYIRPVYWKSPLSPKPPKELNKYNFKYVELKISKDG